MLAIILIDLGQEIGPGQCGDQPAVCIHQRAQPRNLAAQHCHYLQGIAPLTRSKDSLLDPINFAVDPRDPVMHPPEVICNQGRRHGRTGKLPFRGFTHFVGKQMLKINRRACPARDQPFLPHN